MEALSTTSPPAKKRIQDVPESEAAIETKIEYSAIDEKLKRGRGRPPKKAIIAEIEAELARQAEAKGKTTTPEEIPEPSKVSSDDPKSPEGEELKLSKKRGRPKKELAHEVQEEAAEDDQGEPAVKRRALRERKPMSLAEENDEDFEMTNKIMAQRPETGRSEKSQSPPKKSDTSEKSDGAEKSEKSAEKIVKSGRSEKLPKVEKSEMPSENPEKTGKPANTDVLKSPSANNDRYVVQHGANPLKIRLKTGFQEEPQPIKIKFSLKDNDCESNHVKKPKKHKKKKSEKSEKIILRIKSPSNRNEDNGFGTLHEKLASMTSMASPEEAASTTSAGNNEQVTFSPESSPEHQTSTATSFILASKDSNQIGLGEGQFNDLMKAIDSDTDENTKPWMSSAAPSAHTVSFSLILIQS